MSAPDAAPMPEYWPCGCVKGMTAHGVGWGDCAYTEEQKLAQVDEWYALEEKAEDDRIEAARLR